MQSPKVVRKPRFRFHFQKMQSSITAKAVSWRTGPFKIYQSCACAWSLYLPLCLCCCAALVVLVIGAAPSRA